MLRTVASLMALFAASFARGDDGGTKTAPAALRPLIASQAPIYWAIRASGELRCTRWQFLSSKADGREYLTRSKAGECVHWSFSIEFMPTAETLRLKELHTSYSYTRGLGEKGLSSVGVTLSGMTADGSSVKTAEGTQEVSINRWPRGRRRLPGRGPGPRVCSCRCG